MLVRVLKLGAQVYENLPMFVEEPAEFDEQGIPVKFEHKPNPLIPQKPAELAKALKDTLLWLAERRANEVARKADYYGIQDVLAYASPPADSGLQPDEEALEIANWYYRYDDAVWKWLEENLDPVINGQVEMSADELLELYGDMKAVEEEIYKNSL